MQDMDEMVMDISETSGPEATLNLYRLESQQTQINTKILLAATEFEVSKLLGKGAQASVYLASVVDSQATKNASGTQLQLPT